MIPSDRWWDGAQEPTSAGRRSYGSKASDGLEIQRPLAASPFQPSGAWPHWLTQPSDRARALAIYRSDGVEGILNQ